MQKTRCSFEKGKAENHIYRSSLYRFRELSTNEDQQVDHENGNGTEARKNFQFIYCRVQAAEEPNYRYPDCVTSSRTTRECSGGGFSPVPGDGCLHARIKSSRLLHGWIEQGVIGFLFCQQLSELFYAVLQISDISLKLFVESKSGRRLHINLIIAGSEKT